MKKLVSTVLEKYLHEYLTLDEIEKALEIPPDDKFGDYAFPCFPLAKKLRKNPMKIAQDLAKQIGQEANIKRMEVKSGYLNIFLERPRFAQQVLTEATKSDFGKRNDNKSVVIEYCSPNTNKPLHIGHLRNMAIGESISRILAYLGNNINKTCVYNDRGVHICKSMLAYKLFGNNEQPETIRIKPDHLVGKYYVLFTNKVKKDSTLSDQALHMLEQWESGDEETRDLWKKMNTWAFQGFQETFDLFGISFNIEYYESKLYQYGKEIIQDGLDRGIFSRREDGAVFVDLTDVKLDEKVLLRPNGTSVYIVQDLYLAFLKNKDFPYDQSIYVVGNEQEYHFNVLSAILKRIAQEESTDIYHLSYGMVELPDGKMKSREGNVIHADDLIFDTAHLAENEIRKRYDLEAEDLQERAKLISLAAIKYQVLKTDTKKNMVFDPAEAIKFEGDTGPYLLYSYARASNILRKTDRKPEIGEWEINDHENRLLKKIAQFPEMVRNAGEKLLPSLLASYAFELCQQFNTFYHSCPVLKSEQAAFRLTIVQVFQKTIAKCLALLGIEKIEEM